MMIDSKHKVDPPKILTRDMVLPFILVAMLFPLWGFANDVTNPLVKAFKDIFLISNTESSLVQFAFYLGYGIMALPAAVFIRSFTYKSGILLGLAHTAPLSSLRGCTAQSPTLDTTDASWRSGIRS